MYKIDKINIKITDKQSELGESRLEFTIAGNNIDYILINTLRRTIYSEIPIIAFTDFIFNKNTSIFHNNYLKLRISNMPVWGIDNKYDFIEDTNNTNNTNNINDKNNKKEINTNENVDTDNENDENDFYDTVNPKDTDINKSNLKELSMYVNYKNKINNIYTLTTDDVNFYYDQKQIVSPYTTPIPIVKLQENQEISFTAISKIGKENINVVYSAVCIAAYKYNNINAKSGTCNDFTFFLESRGQISEERIILVAIINIKKKIYNFLELINNIKIDEDNIEGELIINNEDNTLGNLISRGLQLHKHISFAGYNLPHPLVKTVHIHYKLNEEYFKLNNKFKIKKIIEDVINYYLEIFDIIYKEF
jgi:DNA-directed RNA polymerase subunit L